MATRVTAEHIDAVWMLMESADGYTESLRFARVTQRHLLATHLNGAPHPRSMLSSPLPLPGHYGMKQPK